MTALVEALQASLGEARAKSARLERALAEAEERQAATAEILKVISGSPADARPVFQAITESAMRLFGAWSASIFRYEGGLIRAMVARGGLPGSSEAMMEDLAVPHAPSEDTPEGRAVLTRLVQHVVDLDSDPSSSPRLRELARVRGFRAVLAVPMFHRDDVVGVVVLSTDRDGGFAPAEVALLQTFAAQAVIAIENARMFDDLGLALEQQTATSELLKAIGGSTFELQPVFETLAESAVRLCEAERALVFRFDGQMLRVVATHNVSKELKQFSEQNVLIPGRQSGSARAALERRVVHIHDAQSDPEYTYGARDVDPIRTVLAIPMLRAGELLGVINIYRHEVLPFTDGQIGLMETFADQAAIAIENARLLTELQTKNADLTEALEQQTATSEILRVISSSPTDLRPVLEAVADSAARLCSADDANIFQVQGDRLVLVTSRGRIPLPPATRPLDRRSIPARAVVDRRTLHIHDLAAESEDDFP